MILLSLMLAATLGTEQQVAVTAPETAPATVEATSREIVLATLQSQPRKFDPSRFDSATAEAIWFLLDTATAHGIPELPLINKAYQGSGMKAPGARIVSTVRAYYLAMLDAREALGKDASPSELETGADALRNGVDGKALVSVRAVRPAGTAVTALMVMTDLIKRGIPSDRARDAVTAIARMSKSDEALNVLQVQVAKNALRGGPGMALDALDRYVRSVVPGSANPAASKPVTRPPSLPDAS